MKMQDDIAQREVGLKNDQRVIEQNSKLAKELERRRTDHERKEREIQRICEESEELKELERRLKVAYMNKERSAQHEERLLVDSMEQQRVQAIEDQMEYDRREALRAEASQAEARRVVGLHQKAALQSQIAAHEDLKDEAAREAAKDRVMVDAVVQRILDEDTREAVEKATRKNETRALIKDYERQRKHELEDKRVREAEEEAKIRAHMNAMAAREETVARLKQEKKDAETAAFTKIVRETEAARAEDDEMQRLRDMLWEEEMEAARMREEQARLEKVARSKAEMKSANEQMLKAKAEQQALEAEEEEKLVKMMLNKFSSDEQLERELEAQRIGEKALYVERIQAQKDERMRMYEQEKAAELADVGAVREAEEYKARVVAEARRRLLAEHAARLDGFLPKSTLNTAEERLAMQQHAEAQGY